MRFRVNPTILGSTVVTTWPVCLAVLGTGTAYGLGRVLGESCEAEIRFTGMLLQLFGLISVAIGFEKLRRKFGRPPLTKAATDWFCQLRSSFKSPAIVRGGVTLSGGIGITAELSKRIVAAPGATVERRLEILELNCQEHQGTLNRQLSGIESRLAEISQAMAQSTSEINHRNREIAFDLEDLAVGGLHLEAVGLVWLGLGVIATSIPVELAENGQRLVTLIWASTTAAVGDMAQWLQSLIARVS